MNGHAPADTGLIGTVEVWRIQLDQPPFRTAELLRTLPPGTAARAGAFHRARDRARFVVAHAAARQLLADRTGIPSATQLWRTGRQGKPFLDTPAPRGPAFNLSHSGDLAVFAVCADREVGVDIEPSARSVGSVGYERLVRRFFTAAEARYVGLGSPAEAGQRAIRLWVRKEACAKALGEGLLRRLDLPLVEDEAAVPVLRTAEGTALRVLDLELGRDHVGAVAMTGSAPFRISHRVWDAARGR